MGKRLCVGLSMAAVLASVPAAPANAAAYYIQGTVLSPENLPVQDICVSAYGDDAGTYADDLTGADGSFELNGLEPDSYVVAAEDCSGDDRYAFELYEDAIRYEDATHVAVGGAEAPNLTIVMDSASSISGTLIDDRGDPAPDVCVVAIDLEGEWLEGSYTDHEGSYVVKGLRAGDVILSFGCLEPRIIYVPVPGEQNRYASPASPDPNTVGWPYGYITEFYTDAATREEATTISLGSEQQLTGIDATVMRASALEVSLSTEDGESADNLCATVETDAGFSTVDFSDDDRVLVKGLAPGEHFLEVSDCGWWKTPKYKSEWFDNASSRTQATAIEIPETDAASVHVHLDLLPAPDLAVNALTVTPTPIQTDAATLPGAGVRRNVSVTVENQGNLIAKDSVLIVIATSRTDKRTRQIHVKNFSLKPGDARTFNAVWDATGSFGDATVTAKVCNASEPNTSNNTKSVDSYAIVGGTGFGFAPNLALPSYSCPPGGY